MSKTETIKLVTEQIEPTYYVIKNRPELGALTTEQIADLYIKRELEAHWVVIAQDKKPVSTSLTVSELCNISSDPSISIMNMLISFKKRSVNNNNTSTPPLTALEPGENKTDLNISDAKNILQFFTNQKNQPWILSTVGTVMAMILVKATTDYYSNSAEKNTSPVLDNANALKQPNLDVPAKDVQSIIPMPASLPAKKESSDVQKPSKHPAEFAPPIKQLFAPPVEKAATEQKQADDGLFSDNLPNTESSRETAPASNMKETNKEPKEPRELRSEERNPEEPRSKKQNTPKPMRMNPVAPQNNAQDPDSSTNEVDFENYEQNLPGFNDPIDKQERLE